MAYPLNRALPAVWPLGPAQSTDNLTGLPNNQARCLGVVNAETIGYTTPLSDLILPPWKITTGSGTVSGNITRYFLLSEDNVLWPGGINPSSTSDQSAALVAMIAADPNFATLALVDQLTASASATAYVTREHSWFALLGVVARYCAVIVYNQSGQALSSTAGNHSATYAAEYFSNA
jgi:hypothetical protein